MTSDTFCRQVEDVRQAILAIEAKIIETDPPKDELRELHTALDHARNSVWAVLVSQQRNVQESVAQLRLDRATAMCRETVVDLDRGVVDPMSEGFTDFSAQLVRTMNRISGEHALLHLA